MEHNRPVVTTSNSGSRKAMETFDGRTAEHVRCFVYGGAGVPEKSAAVSHLGRLSPSLLRERDALEGRVRAGLCAHRLISAQGYEGINARGAEGWDQARERGDDRKQGRHATVDERVERLDLEE